MLGCLHLLMSPPPQSKKLAATIASAACAIRSSAPPSLASPHGTSFSTSTSQPATPASLDRPGEGSDEGGRIAGAARQLVNHALCIVHQGEVIDAVGALRNSTRARRRREAILARPHPVALRRVTACPGRPDDIAQVIGFEGLIAHRLLRNRRVAKPYLLEDRILPGDRYIDALPCDPPQISGRKSRRNLETDLNIAA